MSDNRNELDEGTVIKLYKDLNIDYSQAESVETLAKKYQEQVEIVKIECYGTTAYLYR